MICPACNEPYVRVYFLLGHAFYVHKQKRPWWKFWVPQEEDGCVV